MNIIGYSETPIRITPDHWTPSPEQCLSCGVTLTPGSAGNVAWCDVHDQTCNRCDDDLTHPHGRSA